MRVTLLLDPTKHYDVAALREAKEWCDRHTRQRVTVSHDRDEDDWITASFNFEDDDEARAFTWRDVPRAYQGRVVR